MSQANTNSYHDHSHSEHHGSLKSYVIGFIWSIVLTIIPIVVILNEMFSETVRIMIIVLMAILQLVVQLLYFMHLKEGENSRWNIMALVLGGIILLTIVGGSIWIMMYNQVAH